MKMRVGLWDVWGAGETEAWSRRGGWRAAAPWGRPAVEFKAQQIDIQMAGGQTGCGVGGKGGSRDTKVRGMGIKGFQAGMGHGDIRILGRDAGGRSVGHRCL